MEEAKKEGKEETWVLLNQSSLVAVAASAVAAFFGGPAGEDSVDTRRVAFLTVREVLQLVHLREDSSTSPCGGGDDDNDDDGGV